MKKSLLCIPIAALWIAALLIPLVLYLAYGDRLITFIKSRETGTVTAQNEMTHTTAREYGAPFVSESIKRDHREGYVLVITYMDQLTDATTNVRSLLCLAKRMGVKVVEPFIHGSQVGLDVKSNWTTQVRLTDVFSYDVWKQHTPFTKFGDFVSFESFMKYAPRKLLMVQYSTHPCGDKWVINKGRQFCEINGFQLVGHVCLSYGGQKMLNLSSIYTQLYSNYSQSEVVLMFDIFGGAEHHPFYKRIDYRLSFINKECCRSSTRCYSCLSPSATVMSDANKYIQDHLKGLDYITVMIRLEKVFIDLKIPGNKQSNFTKVCLDNLLRRLTHIKEKTKREHVFITLDFGNYGSDHLRWRRSKSIERHVEEFLSEVFMKRMSLTEWEETFLNITTQKHPGYISMMQKTIAAKGDVLVLVGSGTYQSSARDLYNKFHTHIKNVFQLNRHCE